MYILITNCERELSAKTFRALEEAQLAMKKEFEDAGPCETSEYNLYSACKNDTSVTHLNWDWQITYAENEDCKPRTRGFEAVFSKPDTRLPERSTKHAAGYDFFAREDLKILPHNLKIAWTGVKAYMQHDEVLKLYNRSSMATKKGLMLSDNVAVIDADYYNNPSNEGEIGFMFYNFTNEIAIIKKGEKLGQGIFEKYLKADVDTHGGNRTGGFGSTGA